MQDQPGEIAFIAISILILMTAEVIRPARATCPPAWRHLGVNTVAAPGDARGAFACEYFPFVETDKIISYPGVLHSRVYCRADETPVQVDDRTVACRHTR